MHKHLLYMHIHMHTHTKQGCIYTSSQMPRTISRQRFAWMTVSRRILKLSPCSGWGITEMGKQSCREHGRGLSAKLLAMSALKPWALHSKDSVSQAPYYVVHHEGGSLVFLKIAVTAYYEYPVEKAMIKLKCVENKYIHSPSSTRNLKIPSRCIGSAMHFPLHYLVHRETH